MEKQSKSNFRIFEYFIDGVVSFLKIQRKIWGGKKVSQPQEEQPKPSNVVYFRPKKSNRGFIDRLIQKVFSSKQVKEPKVIKKAVRLKKAQNEVKRFWKGKPDYVDTG